MGRAGLCLLLLAAFTASSNARINAGFSPGTQMPPGWCNLQIPGCNLCYQEEPEMARGAQHPGHEGPLPSVTIVRCYNCTAPLYVFNPENENCDCASGAGSVYRNGTFVDARLDLVDFANVTLDDIFPEGDFNRPPPPPKMSSGAGEANNAFAIMTSAEEAATAHESAMPAMEIMMAERPSSKLSPAISLQRAKKTGRPVRLKSNRFVITNPEGYSVAAASAPPAKGRPGVRKALSKRSKSKALHVEVKTLQGIQGVYSDKGDASDSNNYGPGYSNGNGYSYSYSERYQKRHGSDDNGDGPDSAWWNTLTREGKKAHKKTFNKKSGAHDEDEADNSNYAPEADSHEGKQEKHAHSKHMHGGEDKHGTGKKKEHPHKHHGHDWDEEEADDDAIHGGHGHGGGHSGGGNTHEDDGDSREDGSGPGDWQMVDPDQLVCGACPPNSVSKGGLIGGSFCQPCGVDEVADTKKQICKPAPIIEADDSDDEGDDASDDEGDDDDSSDSKKKKKGHKAAADKNKHRKHGHSHSSSPKHSTQTKSKSSKTSKKTDASTQADDTAEDADEVDAPQGKANSNKKSESVANKKAADSEDTDSNDNIAKQHLSNKKSPKKSQQAEAEADAEDAEDEDDKEDDDSSTVVKPPNPSHKVTMDASAVGDYDAEEAEMQGTDASNDDASDDDMHTLSQHPTGTGTLQDVENIVIVQAAGVQPAKSL